MTKTNKVTSWVITKISDGTVMFETTQRSLLDKLNTDKYRAIPIMEYLQSLNQ